MSLTQKDLDEMENTLKDVFITKEEFYQTKSEIMDVLTDILKEVRDMRDEKDIIFHRVSDHEDRIANIENVVGIASE